MLIKVDKWLDSVLKDTDDLLCNNTKFIQLGEDKYIEIDELIGAIENLNDELVRTNEKIQQMDQEIQNDYIRRKHIAKEYGE